MYISHFVVSLHSLADDPYMKYIAVYLCVCVSPEPLLFTMPSTCPLSILLQHSLVCLLHMYVL